MKMLMLGGSFNPVHVGHLILAEEVAWQFGCERVALVPARQPPHKALRDDPGAQHRLAMLRAAVDGDELFAVDDCELLREGPSYTVDTLRQLRERYRPDGGLYLVIGDDLAQGFTAWREPGTILSLATLIVARRSGRPYDLALPHLRADNSLVPVSSSLVRSRIAQGGAWKRLVPEGARSYIERHGLYR